MARYSTSDTGRQPFVVTKQIKAGIIAVVVALVGLFMIPSIGENVQKEEITVCQAPFSGKMSYWVEPGLKGQWFGRTTTYYKTE